MQKHGTGSKSHIVHACKKKLINIHCGIKKKCIFAALEPAKPLYDAQMCGSFYFILKTKPRRRFIALCAETFQETSLQQLHRNPRARFCIGERVVVVRHRTAASFGHRVQLVVG